MTTDTRPADGFDATIHAENRLRICALLEAVEQIEFALVQERLHISASVLSKHVSVLMEAGYVQQTRAVRDTRQRVWLSRSPGPAGRPTMLTSRPCARS